LKGLALSLASQCACGHSCGSNTT